MIAARVAYITSRQDLRTELGTHDHAEEAAAAAKINEEEERRYIPHDAHLVPLGKNRSAPF